MNFMSFAVMLSETVLSTWGSAFAVRLLVEWFIVVLQICFI